MDAQRKCSHENHMSNNSKNPNPVAIVTTFEDQAAQNGGNTEQSPSFHIDFRAIFEQLSPDKIVEFSDARPRSNSSP